jgi:hypothetical protein
MADRPGATIDERIAKLIMEVDIRVEDLQLTLSKISVLNKERLALEDRKTSGASGGERA